MPFSNPVHMPVVLHYALAVAPQRILDVGIGMGCYGFLLRQFTDIAAARFLPEEWQVEIEGIEVFPKYRNPTWEFAYNTVHIADIRDLLPSLGTYDLIVCGDVLEHFPLAEARLIIESLLSKSRTLIATTPNRDYPQGEWAGNAAETHHCTLKRRDFPHLMTSEVTGITTCYVCCNDDLAAVAIRKAKLTCPRVKTFRYGAVPQRGINKLLRLWREYRTGSMHTR